MDERIQRFSNRATNYAKYRPGYPPALIEILEHAGLPKGGRVADIGSGTGKLTEIFLASGHRVFAVEPNREMRQMAEVTLGHHPNFISVDAQAEATGLPGSSVDWIVIGQAFHWFNSDAARREFIRILCPKGGLAVIWNERQNDADTFASTYQRIVDQYKQDKEPVSHKSITPATLDAFFAPEKPQWTHIDHIQQLDRQGIKGRIFSSSYMPEQDTESDVLLTELDRAFDYYAVDGMVFIRYISIMCYGCLIP